MRRLLAALPVVLQVAGAALICWGLTGFVYAPGGSRPDPYFIQYMTNRPLAAQFPTDARLATAAGGGLLAAGLALRRR